MNNSTAVFLINDDVRAVLCTYEPDAEGKPAKRSMFKTFDPTIKENDLVIVSTNTRHGMTVCKVVEVDVDVDFESGEEIRWIVGSVDQSDYDRTVADEKQALQRIHKAEKARKRNELRDSLLADYADEIKALPIAKHASNEG